MGGVPYGEELRTRVLEEALKGERSVTVIAEEFEITQWLVRSWLKRHYEEHPDDPRRHFVERESANYKREKGASEGAPEGATGSEEDMAKRKKGDRTPVDPALRVKILEEVAKGKRTRADIAAEHGFHQSTITYWIDHPRKGDPKVAKGKGGFADKSKHVEKPFSEARAKFIEAIEAGQTVQEARILVKASGSRAKKWFLAWSKGKALEKARAVYKENLKDPAYRAELIERRRQKKQLAAGAEQQSLDLDGASSKTMTSRPESEPPSRQIPPSVAGQSIPPSAIVRYTPGQQQAEAMGEIIEEAISERNALREMVKIMQREADQKDKKIAAYRRLYGDIQQ
jgi:transposase-like protein